MKDSQASATVFGFQFQINAGIYLMLKYFSNLEKVKIEGKHEDIEISLKNKKKIYAQAKSKENPTSNNLGHSTKLKEALTSLSNVDSIDIENLIYISNLEDNPLNSGTDEFTGISFLSYEELKDSSKIKINKQIEENSIVIDKDKLIIAKIPFYGLDGEQRHKHINDKLKEFLSCISPDLVSFSSKLLSFWEAEFLNNAATKDTNLTISKDDIVWGIIVCRLQTDDVKKYDPALGINEEDYIDAVDKYDKVIDLKRCNFLDYNKIIDLYSKYKMKNIGQSIRIIDFILKHEEEIYELIFPNNKMNINNFKICSKIIAKEIILRSNNIKEIKKGVENYGDK